MTNEDDRAFVKDMIIGVLSFIIVDDMYEKGGLTQREYNKFMKQFEGEKKYDKS